MKLQINILNNMIISHGIRFLTLIVLAFCLSYSFAFAQIYKTYKNSENNFSVVYPADIDSMFESYSGDGCHFNYNDGFDMSVSYFPYAAADNLKLIDVYRYRREELKKVTYKIFKKNWFVLSGYTPYGMVYYTKEISGFSLIIKYPKSLKRKYDKLTKKISRSFKSNYGK